MLDTELHTAYPVYGVKDCDQRDYDPNKPCISDLLWHNYDWLIEQEQLGNCRPIVIENVQRTLLCKAKHLGYDNFECPSCRNINLITRHCHSRFCTSCGVKLQKMLIARAESMSSMHLRRYSFLRVLLQPFGRKYK